MASRASLHPLAMEVPGANFPELKKIGADRYVLAFDASVDETARWSFAAPVGITPNITLVAHGFMASATSGNVVLAASLEAVTPGDAINLNSASSFDTANTSPATAVPGSTGNPFTVTVAVTNNDSIAAGDWVRIQFSRAATNGSDTAAGDYYLEGIELKDTA